MSKKSTTEAAARKRLEREARKAEAQSAEQVTPDVATAASVPRAQEHVAYSISIPTLSHKFPWFASEAHTFDTLDSARDSGIWNYPSTVEQRARCGVFRALWEKGYYLGNGVKFGGEYLIYPGKLYAHLCCLE